MGDEERDSSLSSGVGPGWIGVLLHKWSSTGSPQAHKNWCSGKSGSSLPSPSLAWGCSLLSWHVQRTLSGDTSAAVIKERFFLAVQHKNSGE